MKKSNIRSRRSTLILFFDIILLLAIFNIFFYFRFGVSPKLFSIDFFSIAVCILLTMFVTGTYIREPAKTSSSVPLITFLKAISAVIPCSILIYLLGPEAARDYLGRGVLLISIVCFGVLATASRVLLNKIYYSRESDSRLLYLGDLQGKLPMLREIKNYITEQNIFVTDAHDELLSYGFLNAIDFQESLLDDNWSTIIVDSNDSFTDSESAKLVSLKLQGIDIKTFSDYYEEHLFKIPVLELEDDFLISSNNFFVQTSTFTDKLKRIIDIFFSILILVLSSPLLLVVAFLINLGSAGGVIYSQNRVGLNGKVFKVFKLRSMRANAEKNGVEWSKENDPRITKIGKFIRATRIDEIPQCWNVLKGDMSLIGPRPERPEFTTILSERIPYYDLRHLVKPGLSGWAQVMYPYGSSEEDALKKLEYDLYYIKNQSFSLEVGIFLRTVMTIVMNKGR